MRCPTCKTDVAPRAENPVFPFCSERCRLVDLGKWLGEEYRVPVRETERAPEVEDDSEPDPDLRR